MFKDIFDPFYLNETSLVICSMFPLITSLSRDSDPLFFFLGKEGWVNMSLASGLQDLATLKGIFIFLCL